MKKKQKLAMIAYETQIAGLEENIRNLWCKINPVVDDEAIERIEMRLSRLAAMTEGREQDVAGAFEAFKERLNLLDTRMRHRDEADEALDEVVDELTCDTNAAVTILSARLEKLEKTVDALKQQVTAFEALDEGLANLSAGVSELEACVLRRVEKIETNASIDRATLGEHTKRLAKLTPNVNVPFIKPGKPRNPPNSMG